VSAAFQYQPRDPLLPKKNEKKSEASSKKKNRKPYPDPPLPKNGVEMKKKIEKELCKRRSHNFFSGNIPKKLARTSSKIKYSAFAYRINSETFISTCPS
jgi:hypothetical protein